MTTFAGPFKILDKNTIYSLKSLAEKLDKEVGFSKECPPRLIVDVRQKKPEKSKEIDSLTLNHYK